MFEDEDDFEIDEEFLDGVFDAEKTANANVIISLENNLKRSEVNLTQSPLEKKRISENNDSLKPSTQGLSSRTVSSGLEIPSQQLVDQDEYSKITFSVSSQNTFHVSDVATSNSLIRKRSSKEIYQTLQENGDNKRNQLRPPPNLNSSCQSNSDVKTTVWDRVVCNNGNTNSSLFTNSARVRQRKFPGPAGLLPERGQRVYDNLGCEILEGGVEDPVVPLCSQSALSVLEEGPWTSLQADLDVEGRKLSQHYTIAWIKRKAAARQLHGQKVPFLAAVVHSLDCSSPDPCVVLRDATGEIPGTLHRSVWDSFGGQLVVGSALSLRMVGVLSTGISARRHYLNITDNNIVTIYSASFDNASSNLDTSSRAVRKTHLHKWTLNQLIQTVDSWEEQNRKKTCKPRNPDPLMLQTKGGLNSNFSNVAKTSAQATNQHVNSHAQSRQNTYQEIHRPTDHHNLSTSGSSLDHISSKHHLQGKQTSPLSVPTPSFSSLVSKSCFVPKKPLLSIHEEAKNVTQQDHTKRYDVVLDNLQSQSSCVGISNQQSESCPVLFSNTDDLDVSSVLDGIDSESLFGEF